MNRGFQGGFAAAFYVIMTGAAILYVGLIPHFKTGIYNDDAVYAIVAQDLQNQHASQLLPLIKPDYPLPGLPIILAPLAKLIHSHWEILDWAPVLATLLTLWLLGLWALRWLPPGEALIVTALYAFNPTVVKFSGIIMPAPFYSLAVVAGFFLMDRALEDSTPLRWLGLGILLGWATVIRAEGGVLLVSIMAGLLMARGKKRAAAITMIPILAWFCFYIYWFKFRHLNHSDYAGDITALLTYWSRNFASGLQFSGKFFHFLFVRTLLAMDVKRAAFPFSWVIVLITATGIGFGFLSLWRQKERRAELGSVVLFCGFYLLVHLFWHIALPRYCIALLPFVYLFFIRGVTDRFPKFFRHTLTGLIFIAPLFISYGYGNSHAIKDLMGGENPIDAPPWHTLSWLKKNTPPSARNMSPFAPSIVLYTKRPAVPMLGVGDAEVFRYGLDHEAVDYIVDRPMRFVTPGVGKTENLNDQWAKMRRWIGQHSTWFQLEFHDSRENTMVYRVVHDPHFTQAFRLYYLSVHCFRLGLLEQALVNAKKSLALYPNLGIAHNMLGAIYFSKKDYAQAERRFLEAATLLPDSPTALLNLSTLYHHQGQQNRAIETLNKAADRIDPDKKSKKHLNSLEKVQDNWSREKELMFI